MMAPAQSFPAQVTFYRERLGVSRHAFSKKISVDPSYMTRIENGGRGVPGRGIVSNMARELRLNPEERNRLFMAAGYLTDDLMQLGGWPTSVQAVLDVLAHPRIPPEVAEEFDTLIERISFRYLLSIRDR